MGWCRSLTDMDVSCAFLRGKPQEVEEPLFFEPPSRGLPGLEKGALIEIANMFSDYPILPVGGGKNCVTRSNKNFSNSTLPSSACETFSGHLIGIIIVHVDDMLLTTDNSHKAESHFSRLMSKNDTKYVKRADENGGVLYCGKRVRTVPDDMEPGSLPVRQD